MPFDSNGNYTLPTSYFVENGDTVLPIQHNPPFEDVAQALSSVLPRSGVAPMNGPLKMGGNKVTGMADGTATTDGVTKQQMDAVGTAASDAAALNAMKFVTKSAAYTAVKADKATAFRFTAAATLSLPAAETLGANWWCEVQATNGYVTIDPNGAETVDGTATAIIQTGQIARISCNGTAFATEIVGNPLSGPHLQGFAVGLGLSTNATDAANDVDVAVGAASSDSSPYYLMQLTSPLTKRLDAAWAAGSNQGCLDTGTVLSSGTYFFFEIQRSDTLATEILASLSSTAPTMPANYDRKRLIGTVVRTGGVNGNPVLLTDPTPDIPISICLNGTGTIAVRSSKGVASITDLGTGRYKINFSANMPDANYPFTASSLLPQTTQMSSVDVQEVTASSITVKCTARNIGLNDESATDLTHVSVMIGSKQ